MYIINPITHGKCFCTVFTHLLFLYQKSFGILLVRCVHSFDFWYVNNLCVNIVRQHFPWSILYMPLQCCKGFAFDSYNNLSKKARKRVTPRMSVQGATSRKLRHPWAKKSNVPRPDFYKKKKRAGGRLFFVISDFFYYFQFIAFFTHYYPPPGISWSS